MGVEPDVGGVLEAVRDGARLVEGALVAGVERIEVVDVGPARWRASMAARAFVASRGAADQSTAAPFLGATETLSFVKTVSPPSGTSLR